jgi:Uma2 family endonuclease
MAAKAQLYLDSGVRLVWVIWPRARRVEVWSANRDASLLLDEDDTLEGGEVLPGFSVSVPELFPSRP